MRKARKLNLLCKKTGEGAYFQWGGNGPENDHSTPPPTPVPIDDVLPAMRGIEVWRRAWDVPRGVYFIVLDHTIAAGRTSLPQAQLDDRAALVSYAVRIVDP